MATNLQSHKLYKQNGQDIQGTSDEIKMNSKPMYFYGCLHIDTPMLAN